MRPPGTAVWQRASRTDSRSAAFFARFGKPRFAGLAVETRLPMEDTGDPMGDADSSSKRRRSGIPSMAFPFPCCRSVDARRGSASSGLSSASLRRRRGGKRSTLLACSEGSPFFFPFFCTRDVDWPRGRWPLCVALGGATADGAGALLRLFPSLRARCCAAYFDRSRARDASAFLARASQLMDASSLLSTSVALLRSLFASRSASSCAQMTEPLPVSAVSLDSRRAPPPKGFGSGRLLASSDAMLR
mmetsp:Transcript_12143/g.36635  ORF Transcript_12143/g.36635 Transcript_12143/m.36635 type:complete len:246 (-) Transcript_12143:469-1206(-)